MNCPPELAIIIAKMVEKAILKIRGLGWADQGDRCAIEADHVHNLPGLLADYSPERLDYYWRCERSSYLARIPRKDQLDWEDLWNQMRPHVETTVATLLNR